MSTKTFLSLLIAAFLMIGNAAAESAFQYPMVVPGRVLLELRQPLPGNPKALSGAPVSTGLAALDTILARVGARSVELAVPRHLPKTYLVKFSGHQVEEAVNLLKNWPGTAEVWPCPLVPQLGWEYQANDLLIPSQWHLNQIKAPTEWGIYQGSDTIQVAIIDGGVNYIHPDLAGNVWINPGEDLNHNGVIDPSDWNNLDDDGNGYVDDFWGWDWINLDSSQVFPGEDPGPPDNDPSDFDGHGTHCAGDACAASDNGLGVASPGFHSQIMCLRAGYLSNTGNAYVDIQAAIQATYYAIDMHAEVISMSYGGDGYPPELVALQAAQAAGLVLVAAAGNEHVSTPLYPAAYPGVIAVAATAPGDVLADFTSYGTWITLCAPGVAIMSTTIGGYGNMEGTSMATPITAGVAAMVKSLKHEWTSTQVGAWLAQTADNIDQQNPGYIGMMGGGRLNAAHAVDLFVSVDSLWARNSQGGSRMHYGENDSLFVQFHKYRGQATSVQLTLTSPNPRVSISQPDYFIGNLNQGQSGSNSNQPFVLNIQQGEDSYETIELAAHFSGDGFEFTQKLYTPVGRGQVLIIDADQNQTQQTSSYYEKTLNDLGMTWETWRRSEMTALSADIQQYPCVIHFSGTAQTNIFPGTDWDVLTAYMNAGGKLIVSGQNDAQDLAVSQPAVLANILRVTYLAPTSNNMSVFGAPGNVQTQGMEMIMAGGGGAWNQNSMDMVTALLGADPWFVYRTETPSQLAGVRTQIGSRDLFYCAFGIEGINDSTQTGTTRTDVLRLMLTEFGLLGVSPTPIPFLPTQLTLSPPYPNPFNGVLNIGYTLPKAGPVTLAVYDVSGRLVAAQKREWAPAGAAVWTWQADPRICSGIYMIKLQSASQTLSRKAVYLK